MLTKKNVSNFFKKIHDDCTNDEVAIAFRTDDEGSDLYFFGCRLSSRKGGVKYVDRRTEDVARIESKDARKSIK